MKRFTTPMTHWRKLLVFAVFASLIWYACTPAGKPTITTNFVTPSGINYLSPNMPFDIDTTVKKQLEAEGKFAEVQRLFEVLSWQAFIGLNWPYQDGQAQATISSEGTPKWNSWKESFEVYKSDGSAPTPWGEYDIPDQLEGAITTDCNKVLYRTSKFSHTTSDFADEIDQAFSTKIWDQNGNLARYEVRMNEVEFDYLVEQQLYNFDGQIAFAKRNGSPVVNFPSGSRSEEGSIEIKLAWKIIEDNDPFAGRYYTTEACVYNEDKTFSAAKVGLIGMHISMKTLSSPQWIWATFEHVDNLEVNPLEVYNGQNLKPSFNDPDCAICPINVLPTDTANYGGIQNGTIKNQIQRIIPIPMATQALNAEVQAQLRSANSPFQYYQLIGAQWPTQPKAAAYPVGKPGDNSERKLPDAVTNKSGGFPTPAYLTNMIMETYFQGATQGADYNYMIANEPSWLQIEGFPKSAKNANIKIFGTEGCTGCHSSCSIAIDSTRDENGKLQPVFAQRYDYDSQVIGDFSWLMQLKASFASK